MIKLNLVTVSHSFSSLHKRSHRHIICNMSKYIRSRYFSIDVYYTTQSTPLINGICIWICPCNIYLDPSLSKRICIPSDSDISVIDLQPGGGNIIALWSRFVFAKQRRWKTSHRSSGDQ